MKATIEWQDISEETKDEIEKDIKEEQEAAKVELEKAIKKLRNDNKVLGAFRAAMKVLPGMSAALDSLDALKGYTPIEFRLISRSPMVVEIEFDSFWFEQFKALGLGPVAGMIASEKRMLKDIRERSESYGKIRRFETA